MKRKVCVVVTARPSYSRVKTALEAIRDHPDLELQLVVTASALLDRYGDVSSIMETEGFNISARVFMVLEGETLETSAKSTGVGLMELSTAFSSLAPDVVVTVADRHETMATAVAAAFMNIPLAHIQGGEITGSIDEKVRHAVTKLADLHFVATEKAKVRVVKMGERPETVFLTGCPSVDLAMAVQRAPSLDFDPAEKYGGNGADLDLSNGYLVVMQHAVTTEYRNSRDQITETLHTLHETAIPTVWFWPNEDAGSDGLASGIRAYREFNNPGNIRFFKNMAPDDFLRLLINSRALVGNSSVGIRECSYLAVPAINIGSRQSGRERGGNVVDVGYDRHEIKQAIERVMADGRPPSDMLYGDGTAGRRIAELLAEVPLRIEKRLAY